METSLSNNGYKVKKKNLKSKQIQEIKKELTVNPFCMNGLMIKLRKDLCYTWRVQIVYICLDFTLQVQIRITN